MNYIPVDDDDLAEMGLKYLPNKKTTPTPESSPFPPWTGKVSPGPKPPPPMATSLHWGLKSKIQAPWFMLWREYKVLGEIVYAEVLFDSGILKKIKKLDKALKMDPYSWIQVEEMKNEKK